MYKPCNTLWLTVEVHHPTQPDMHTCIVTIHRIIVVGIIMISNQHFTSKKNYKLYKFWFFYLFKFITALKVREWKTIINLKEILNIKHMVFIWRINKETTIWKTNNLFRIMLSVKRKQIIINQNKYFLPQYIYKKVICLCKRLSKLSGVT